MDRAGSICRMSPAALFGLIVPVIVCASPRVLNDGDTFTHIAAGEWMLSHGAVLRADPFSATFAGQPWVAHEWLAEVSFGLVAGFERLAGWRRHYSDRVAVVFVRDQAGDAGGEIRESM